jgi:hypothetical protein
MGGGVFIHLTMILGFFRFLVDFWDAKLVKNLREIIEVLDGIETGLIFVSEHVNNFPGNQKEKCFLTQEIFGEVGKI